MRIAVPGPACALLLSLVGACGTDQRGYPITGAPPEPPPASVQYSLWTASGTAAAVMRLAPEQLTGTGDRTPATAVTTPSAALGLLTSIAFDAGGNLWLTSSDDNRLVSLGADALATSGDRPARAVITAPAGSLSTPVALAFDPEGHLWVANYGNGTLVRFDELQATAGGERSPRVVVGGAGFPLALAFDDDGALWVSDNQANTISKYTAGQLASSGSPQPAVVLRAPGSSSFVPLGLAFDANGNLWVANVGAASVVSFSPSQLAVSGSPEPRVVVSTALGVQGLPVGLAFDQAGSLWVVGASELAHYTAESLAASGAPAPAARLTLGGHSLFWNAAFWPKPAGLPLN